MHQTESFRGRHMPRFQSLAHPGRALQFPCDASGRVVMDVLSPGALDNYLFARMMVGKEILWTAVVPAEPS